jgi:hypothetical protein
MAKRSTETKLSRSIPLSVQFQLIAASAGHCQFVGCNKYLFAHPLTQQDGNFSEKAHIRPFSPLGPRGRGRQAKSVHALENVMLLCRADHKLIDKNPTAYPVDVLRRYKEEHERRMLELTDIGPELRTTVLQLKGVIGGQQVDIPAPEIRAAIAPRYAADRMGHVIDLSGLRRESPEFFLLARNEISRQLRPILGGGFDGPKVQHFSVFALAPIPVLAVFGRELGDKVTADLYQRHRDPQSWKWKTDGKAIEYEFRSLRQGTDPLAVGLLLSLSGEVAETSLPRDIDHRYTLYEIAPKDVAPNRELVRLREDLIRFRRAYQHGLATILKNHDGVRELHLFPAVPAPVAIACGQELLPKVHPDLLIYDNVKGIFHRAITINTGEDL